MARDADGARVVDAQLLRGGRQVSEAHGQLAGLGGGAAARGIVDEAVGTASALQPRSRSKCAQNYIAPQSSSAPRPPRGGSARMRRTGPCASRARPSASLSCFLRTESWKGTGAAPSASGATKPLRSDSRDGVAALCGGRPHSVVVGLVKHERLVPLTTTTGGLADGSVSSVKRSRMTHRRSSPPARPLL